MNKTDNREVPKASPKKTMAEVENEVEQNFKKMDQESVMEIYNRSKQAKLFLESEYGSLIMDQLKFWVESADDIKKSSRLYNYEMNKDGRKLYIAAMMDEVRRDTIQDIIDTVQQDIRMGGYAEKELKNRG